ncbi:hypothetical protein [Streptacidiphilus cavernicola]|uniref:Translation initiation factor 2 n=1 Tax=Streptacidiphilus cavernicola TaxID=3342716 RepID=A0ABV6VNA2_9ACTN
MFGLSPEWLLEDGRPFVDAMVLSHPEQVERLKAACPEAAEAAVLGGDPCFDRLLAARQYRERFRRAFGVRAGQRLVVLNSTWNPQSLFGDDGGDVLPHLLHRLVEELPADEYRIVAVLHPNIWYGHGPGQVRYWLDRAQRAGLTLVDPLEHWRQALIAADAVLGDGGSVTYYAAAAGVPVVLARRSLDLLAPDSPVGRFNRTAPVLDLAQQLAPQLERLITTHRPLTEPAELTTSVPGRSAELLRSALYDLVGVPEPDRRAQLDPLPLPPWTPPEHTVPLRVATRVTRRGEVQLHRFAGPMPEGVAGAVHTAVHEDTVDVHTLALADVIHRHGRPDDVRLGSPTAWCAEILARWPHCQTAVYVTGPGTCVLRTTEGLSLELSADDAPAAGAAPAALASAVHAWLAEGRGVRTLVRRGLRVHTGRHVTSVQVRRSG